MTGDATWRASCEVLQRPDLMALTAAQRRARETELEALLEFWTTSRDAEEAMTLLQRVGVAAGVVRTPMALDRDPHLLARGFWHRYDLPFIGPHRQSSAPFREGRDPYPTRREAPTLGQDTEAILCGRLGLSVVDPERLAAVGIIGTIPQRRRAQSDA